MDMIQTGAILASALGVFATIFWVRRIARRRATLDILLIEETKPEMTKQRMDFNVLRQQGSLSQWATPENINSENTALLRTILNRYELVSIGVHQGIIDEESYRTWCRSALVKDWTICKPFVAQLRQTTQTPALYDEFEKLARRWANAQEKPHV